MSAASVQRRMLDRAYAAGRITEAQYRISLQSFGLHDVAAEGASVQADAKPIDEQCFELGICPTVSSPADMAEQWRTAVLLIMRGDPLGQRIADDLRAAELDRYVMARGAK